MKFLIFDQVIVNLRFVKTIHIMEETKLCINYENNTETTFSFSNEEITKQSFERVKGEIMKIGLSDVD